MTRALSLSALRLAQLAKHFATTAASAPSHPSSVVSQQQSRSQSRSAYKKQPLNMSMTNGTAGKDPRTMACLIIGDEVLGGKTQDTNSHVGSNQTSGDFEKSQY